MTSTTSRPNCRHVSASHTFFFSFRKEVLLPDMNLSTVVALVSLAACLACSDAEPTNMIFMLMDDVSFSHSPRRDINFNKFCGCMHRWAGETSACTAIQQKKHPTWTRWRLRECCYRITTLPIRSALLVCGFIIKINNQWLCAANLNSTASVLFDYSQRDQLC